MPIVTVPLGPGPVAVGPGLTVEFQSDFVGPLPIGTTWHYAVTDEEDLEFDRVFLADTFGGNTNPARATFMTNVASMQVQGRVPTQSENVRVQVRVQDQGANVIDESIITMPWDGTRGLGAQQLLTPTSSGGGLTAEQAQQLARIDVSTAVKLLVNAITLEPLTAGPTGDPIIATLPATIFGVIVRLDQLPEGLAPQTPDEQYWVKTLATVRLFRGNDLWLRAPIHTPTKIVNLHSEAILMGLADITVGAWILDLRILVDFLPGVTGEVFLMRFP